MSEGFKRPGQGSRVDKAQPFSLRGGEKKRGNKNQAIRKTAAVASPSCPNSSAVGDKRAREDDDEELEDSSKKARAETYTPPTDLSAFRAPIGMPATVSEDPGLADFFDGAAEDGKMEFEDVDIESVDDSPDHNPLYPGLCTVKAAEANLAHSLAEREKEREGRAKELAKIAEVASTIPDLAITASYNAYRNCPFRSSDAAEGRVAASRGEDIFEDGVLSLEGDKQYLSWTRLGSDFATVYLKAADLIHIKWKGEADFAALEVHKAFPDGFEGPAETKVYNFLFRGEDVCKHARAFWSALKTLRKVTRPDPTTIPAPLATKGEHNLPTATDSAYGGSPPPIATPTNPTPTTPGHTPAELEANHASTLLFRTALATHGTKPLWEGKPFTKTAMIAFLSAKDTFHAITDSTAFARGLGSKSKPVVQARVISYLQTYPSEGVMVEGKKKGTPRWEGARKREEGRRGAVVKPPGLFAAEYPQGVVLGFYGTDERAMEVVQEAMIREAREKQVRGG